MTDRESALEHFRRLGAHFSPREVNEIPVLGIQLCNRPVTDNDLCYLQAFRGELDVVGLEGTPVTDTGLHHLCSLPKLDNIDLTNTAVTDAGLKVLSTIATLEYLHVERTQVTPTGIAKLQLALPRCEIVWDDYGLPQGH